MSIKTIKLNKVFNGKVHALKGVDLEFKKNKITGLVGFNGSGKTTAFNILSNFIEDYSGKLTIEGEPFSKKWYKKIYYLASGSENKNYTKSYKHLESIGFLYGLKKKDIKKIVTKYSSILDFDKFLNKSIKSLSKGNQQKVKIISSLLNPNLEYLFLDEPFDGLDPIMVNKVKKIYMALKNVTIIITSHRMDIVQSMCDEFYILKEGDIIDFKDKKDKRVALAINKEVNLDEIKKLKNVEKIFKIDHENIIILNTLEDFKIVNKILIDKPNYKYSSLKERNIADSVFGNYS